MRELIDKVQHAIFSPIMRETLDKIIGPDVIGTLGAQPHARTIRQPQPPPLACFAGTFSPSRRQIHSTRLSLTTHPAFRSNPTILQ
jgi:hypothetical protein